MNQRLPEDWENQRSGGPILGSINNRMDRILSQWSENGSQIERPLKAVFVVFLLFTIMVVTAQNVVTEYQTLLAPHNRTAVAAENLLREYKRLGTDVLARIANVVETDTRFRKAVLARDSDEIKEFTDKVFTNWARDVHISEFSIYTADQKLLYRGFGSTSHEDPEFAFQSDLSIALSRTTSSLEFGNNDEIAASIFRPWIYQGTLLGYLKIAVDIEHPLALAGEAVNAEVVKVYGSYPHSNADKTSSPGDIGKANLHYKVLGPLKASPAALETILGDGLTSTNSSSFYLDGNRILFSQDLPNKIINSGPLAKLVLIRDVTDNVLVFTKDTLVSLLAGIGLALLSWMVFKRLLDKLQLSVRTTRSRLEAAVVASTKELELSRAKLIEAQKIASFGSWERDIETNEIRASDEFYRITGVPSDMPSDKKQEHLFTRVPAKELALAKKQVNEAIATCGEFDFEHTIAQEEGTARCVHVRGYVVADVYGKPSRVIGTIHDITERWQAEHQNNLLASILSSSLNEIYILNADTFAIEYANACALKNLGYTLDEIRSQKIWDINSRYREESVKRHVAPLLRGKVSSLSMESTHIRRNGSDYPVDLQVQVLKDRGRNLFVGIANDISDRVQRDTETREAKDRAELLAYFDPLTKLSNRAGCQRDAKSRFSSKDKPAFLVHVDMDNFKRVNDTLGHLAGDYCLEETGRRLREVSRGLGTPYRWGGDEFVILADTDLSDPNELCERARRVMREPMDYNGNRFWPTVSMGIALCPENGSVFDTLLVNADLALYQSKDSGKDRYTFFTLNMKVQSDEEAQIELELHRAVKNDEFFLEFQPQVNLRNQKITGVEALVRWRHPNRGVISPGQFLPVVEKTGLAPVLGNIVINKAFSAAKAWQENALDFGRISINISPAHLSSGQLIEHFQSAMSVHGIAADRITAEVLESVFLDDERTGHLSTLTELNQLGVHIELDDFGTGYASLTHVADLPINGLKIDRSFTNQMLDDRKKEIVVNQLIHLARSLDIGVVCEGVETEAQYDRLRMMGDFSIQGFLIARPMPLDQVTSWMSDSAEDLYFVI
ncbi:MAG: EAL domain-containing protein [Roseibium sp.]